LQRRASLFVESDSLSFKFLQFVGTVVNGVLNSGTVKTGDVVMLGPDSLGHFVQTSVKSIQRKRAPVNSAEAGQSVSCVALSFFFFFLSRSVP